LSPLFGRSIIVWPDNDEPGLKFLDALNEAVHEKNTLVSVIKLDELNLESKDDVVDWVEKRAAIGQKRQSRMFKIL
jgi:DNA primase